MKRLRRNRPGPLFLLLLLSASFPAAAQVRTQVNLAGKDDSLLKLGRPGIRVQVDAVAVAEAASLAQSLRADILALTHSRPLAAEEAGDYQLRVRLGSPTRSVTATVLRFEAELAEPDGTRLWKIDGRTEAEGVPLDGAALTQLGRNVISALVHDGWLQAKDDPNNPPPPPPTVRREPK